MIYYYPTIKLKKHIFFQKNMFQTCFDSPIKSIVFGLWPFWIQWANWRVPLAKALLFFLMYLHCICSKVSFVFTSENNSILLLLAAILFAARSRRAVHSCSLCVLSRAAGAVRRERWAVASPLRCGEEGGRRARRVPVCVFIHIPLHPF